MAETTTTKVKLGVLATLTPPTNSDTPMGGAHRASQTYMDLSLLSALPDIFPTKTTFTTRVLSHTITSVGDPTNASPTITMPFDKDDPAHNLVMDTFAPVGDDPDILETPELHFEADYANGEKAYFSAKLEHAGYDAASVALLGLTANLVITSKIYRMKS